MARTNRGDIAPAAPATTAGTVTACAAVVFWGLGNVLVKHIRLSGVALAFNRLCVGSLVFTALLYVRGGRITVRTLRLAAPGGIAFGLDVALFFTAVKHTTVADASVITALQPALVFLVAGRLFGERVTVRTVAWTGLAILGVMVAVAGSSSSAGRTLEGDMVAVVSLAAWAWYFVASKQSRQQLGALEYQAALTIVAAVVLAPYALLTSGDLLVRDRSTMGWVLIMVLVPGGGHLLMNWAHSHAPITLTSLLTLGIPVVATVGAAALLAEPVTAIQTAGMAVVIVALAMVLWRPGASIPVDPGPVEPL